MNNEETRIPLFRRCVLQNFPFIEQDFDALTDYALLCKVVEYLNAVITVTNENSAQVEALSTAFNNLKNYVDHYFDNLDVQEEINNKLDAMAQSGELFALIKPYIDPIFDEQNERISDIESMVESATSGSPAGVYATVSDLETADPDHSRIYVVTEDGHWYYYANSQWNDGGAYQTAMTTSDIDKVIYRNNVLSDTTENVFNIEKLATATDWTLDENGVASGTIYNLRESFDDTTKIIDFNGATSACIELTARNTGESNSSRGLTVEWHYHDGTTTGNSLLNNATTWTTLTAPSSSLTKEIDYIKFTYGSAGNNVWEVKNVKCILNKRSIPEDFPNHFTAKDIKARKDVATLQAEVNAMQLDTTIDKIYGIKVATDGTVTRTNSASSLNNDYIIGDTMAGSGTNDFDSVFPWSQIKICNIKTDTYGIDHIYYADDDSFSRDGSNGDVFVEIPKFYTRRYIDSDGADNIEISGIKRSGFVLEPAFTDSITGEEIEHIYVGAYLSSDNGSTLDSKSGAFPMSKKKITQIRQLNGEMYDFVTLQALQKLIAIEFGAINLTPYMGGLSNMVWSSCRARETVSNTNTAIFGGASYINNLVVGSTVGVSDTFGDVQNRTVTAIEEIDSNVRRITFDGTPVNVTNGVTYLYSTGQKSGVTDSLDYHTGRVNTVSGETMANQFRYRYIEGLWGNLGEFIDGILVKRLKAYWSNIKADYGDITKGKVINFDLPEQNTYINSPNAKPQQIKEMGLDFHYPEIMLPKTLATYDDTYYGDSFYSFYDENQQGQPLDPDTIYVGVSSMAWDGNIYNGAFTLRFWNTVNTSSNLYGARLIKRH